MEPRTINQSKLSEIDKKQLVRLYQNNDLNRLVSCCKELMVSEPNDSFVCNLISAAYIKLGQFSAAEKFLEQAKKIDPKNSEVLNNYGVLLESQGKLNEAINVYQEVLAINPELPDAHYNLGNLHLKLRDYGAAIVNYKNAISKKQDFNQAYINLSTTLRKVGRYIDSESVAWQAIKKLPHSAESFNNLGNTLVGQKKYDAALVAYRTAIAMNPEFIESKINLGVLYKLQGEHKESIRLLEELVQLGCADDAIFVALGNSYMSRSEYLRAISAFEKAYEQNPNNEYAAYQLYYLARKICDWRYAEKIFERIKSDTNKLDLIRHQPGPPLGMLLAEDDPKNQLDRSIKWSQQTFVNKSVTGLPVKAIKEKIRIGYFSADFREHPVMYQLAGLLREHDRNKFEIYLYSLVKVKDVEDPMYKVALNSSNKFTDLSDLSDEEVVQVVRGHAIDVAVDLTGYTEGSRFIFQYRLAMKQVNFLGYPGSLGVNYIDYMIADKIVVPPSSKDCYAEKILYLPDSFMPTDDMMAIAKGGKHRESYCLPQDAFVFCCFNSCQKISFREYDIWMKILKKINGSVLWLLDPGEQAKKNLIEHAVVRGVAASRIVFAKRVSSHAEHLARYRVADLFLDTFNYNAHSTACEAIYAGLPLVTLQGQQFSARVASSLLTAADLCELIAHSEEEYERLILNLASDSELLLSFKKKLKTTKFKSRLFDTKRYAKNFEKILCQIVNHN